MKTKLSDKYKIFIKKNKFKIILLPFYLIIVFFVDFILGICTEKLWDKLVKRFEKTNIK